MTIEEIKKATETQPELIAQIAKESSLIKGMEAEGLVIRTKEEDKTYVESQLNAALPGKVEEKFNSKFKESLDSLDAEIATLTSVPKNVNEKTTDYAKRAFRDFHAKGGDPVTKEKVKELEKLLEDAKKDAEAKIAAKETELFNREIDYQVSSVMSGLNIAVPAHLKTDKEKQEYANQQKALIKQGFLGTVKPKKDNEGNIVFYEGDKPLMNTKDGKPKNAGEIINEKFSSWFIPQGQQGAGTGAGPAGTPSGFKSKDDIHKYLATQGVEVGSKDYVDQFEKLTTDNKIAV